MSFHEEAIARGWQAWRDARQKLLVAERWLHCLHDLKTLRNDRNSNFFLDIEPNFDSGEIPIGPDMIHVSGGDAERDFENDWSRW